MDNRIYLKYLTCSLPVILIILLFSCKQKPDITVEELEGHVKYLASDSLKGRMAGSQGDSLAAEYIRNELSSLGFVPLSGDGYQRFTVTSRLVPGDENALSIEGEDFIPEKDFIPLGFSSDSELESEVIFVGYGFNINTDSLKWNDYQYIDVKGNWVMILRADPEIDNSASPLIPYSGDRDKAMLAKDMGAAGVLLVSGSALDPQDTFESLNSEDFPVGIPAFRIKRELADLILSKKGTTVTSLERKINSSRKPSGLKTGVTLSGKSEIIREMNVTRNVVMVLPGEDEQLKDEYIIVGAHFDHLGLGGPGSSSMAGDTLAIHHGADDNASGVSLMIELAEKFAMTKGSHKRSIVCIAFAAEELGLLGSKYFAENPGIDLSRVNAMINLDMVGRLQETNTLQVSGIGTAEGLRELVVSETDTNRVKLVFSDEGSGRSDHTSFYGKNIPVLFYFTGAHTDYHKPSDTYDRINYPGMVTISTLIFKVSAKLATSPERLRFREAGPKPETRRITRKKMITLGIMPDYAGIVKNGLRADEVYPGRPGATGGMKKGDIITAINGKTVNNIQDYMFRMGQLKYGQMITVEVLRGDEKIVLLIQL